MKWMSGQSLIWAALQRSRQRIAPMTPARWRLDIWPAAFVVMDLDVLETNERFEDLTRLGQNESRHRSAPTRRSVIVRRTLLGGTLETVRIDDNSEALAVELAKAGERPEVILEATYGWYWAVDVLEACGATVHLAHPLGTTGATSG